MGGGAGGGRMRGGPGMRSWLNAAKPLDTTGAKLSQKMSSMYGRARSVALSIRLLLSPSAWAPGDKTQPARIASAISAGASAKHRSLSAKAASQMHAAGGKTGGCRSRNEKNRTK